MAGTVLIGGAESGRANLAPALAIEESLLEASPAQKNWNIFITRGLLGDSLLGQEKYRDAEPLILESYEAMFIRRAGSADKGERAAIYNAADRAMRLYGKWGQPAKANEWRKKMVAVAEIAGVSNPA